MPFLTADGWLRCLRLSGSEVPELLVLEGTWWAADKTATRLAALEGARELALPGIHHGWYGGVPVAFCFVYGAARAVEPVHIFGEIGATPAVVLIGSCGGIAPQVRTGDVVLPERSLIEESTSRHYPALGGAAQADPALGGAAQALGGAAQADPALATELCGSLERRDMRCHRGTTVTTSALLTQRPEQVSAWADAGLLGVDMETSAVYSAAAHFGMQSAALLFCWDELTRGRSWLDTFTPEEVAAQRAADQATYAAALEIGCATKDREIRPWN